MMLWSDGRVPSMLWSNEWIHVVFERFPEVLRSDGCHPGMLRGNGCLPVVQWDGRRLLVELWSDRCFTVVLWRGNDQMRTYSSSSAPRPARLLRAQLVSDDFSGDNS